MDKQDNDKKKKDKRTNELQNTTQKIYDWALQTLPKTTG